MDSKLDDYSSDEIQVFTSLDGHFAISDILTQTLKTARHRLLISSPWFGKSFVDLIRKTIPDGISIHIITRLPKDNYENTFDAIDSLYEIAGSHNWKITVHGISRHHPKFIVIDDNSCIAGSLNPTESGLYYNLELGIRFKSRSIAQEMTDFFFEMEKTSVKWNLITDFHGLDKGDFKTVLNKLAEKYIAIFLGNGNMPTLKWKICRLLKLQGFEERDIVEVERKLIKQGVLYEPKLDWICLTCVPT